jgi:DNA-binding CsgD family transcriptional regulator
MNEAAARSLVDTIRRLRTASTAGGARRAAATGLQELGRLLDRNAGGRESFADLIHEVRESRIQALRNIHTAADHTTVAFSALGDLGLTRRECEVLDWIRAGKRDAEIAAILGISKRTVGKHIEHLLTKLHVETRTGAVNAVHERSQPSVDRRRIAS